MVSEMSSRKSRKSDMGVKILSRRFAAVGRPNSTAFWHLRAMATGPILVSGFELREANGLPPDLALIAFAQRLT
jgi:hypothetical protein